MRWMNERCIFPNLPRICQVSARGGGNHRRTEDIVTSPFRFIKDLYEWGKPGISGSAFSGSRRNGNRLQDPALFSEVSESETPLNPPPFPPPVGPPSSPSRAFFGLFVLGAGDPARLQEVRQLSQTLAYPGEDADRLLASPPAIP